MRVDVELPGTGGTTLRGWLFLPTGRGPWPAVVLAHGFSATKEMGLVGWAEAMAEAGFVALAYDHRGLGASDGEPRQVVDPWAQARDYRHALTWLAGRPEVDPDRMALWGSSFSGGEVIAVGAVDDRVRAVVANAPWAGSAPEYGDTTEAFAAFRNALLGDGEPGDAAGPFAVVDEPGNALPVFLPQEEATRWFGVWGKLPDARWENHVMLRMGPVDGVGFDPGVCIAHLGKPLLMIVTTEDRVAPTDAALAAFERAGEPKQLELLPGDHFVDYDGVGFEKAVAATIAFLRRWL